MEIFRDYYAYGTFILSHLQSFPKCKLAKNAEFVLKLIKSIPNNVKIDPHWIRECLKHNVFPSSDEHHLQEIRKLLKKNAPSD